MARVSSQKSSFQHLYDAPVQRRTFTSDDYFTSHGCGFCVTSLGLWSSSRSAHQATHQSFQAGTSSATQNYAQVGSSSCTFIFIETAVRIRVRYSRGIFWWRHSLKMADHENVFLLALALARQRSYLHALSVAAGMCVLERSHPATTCDISFAGTWFPCEESTTVIGSGVDLRTGDSPSQPVRSREDAMSCQTAEALHTALGKKKESGRGGGGASTVACSLESQHQRYHEKSHQPMDRGDCQGSLHASWSRVWPSYGTWGQSTVRVMGVQLSGGITWHPVSGVLEVIWGLPEFVSTGHGLYRWWHVYSGSSGGRTASCGSKTSSPSSIAYTICMQPLLRCSRI